MLLVERLAKAYAGQGERRVDAVRDVSLHVPPGRLFTLLGPSGCGKTTTLRCVAGLERPDTGVITLAGRVVSDPGAHVHVPPDRRGLGMVFQAPTVWPHMTVRDNVAFPLVSGPRSERPSRAETDRRVAAVLERVRLEGLGGRPATDLSGGQQQRIALARALVREPRILLLDEPFSSLDESLRADLRGELGRIQRDLGVTTLYVTHDQAEALALSDLMAVVRDGLVEQVGTPRAVYERPETPFVARFMGGANLLPGLVEGRDDGALVVRTRHGLHRVRSDGGFEVGADVLVVARPEHVGLRSRGSAGVVVAQSFLGDAVELVVEVGPEELRVRMPVGGAVLPGSRVDVCLEDARLSLVGPEAGDAG